MGDFESSLLRSVTTSRPTADILSFQTSTQPATEGKRAREELEELLQDIGNFLESKAQQVKAECSKEGTSFECKDLSRWQTLCTRFRRQKVLLDGLDRSTDIAFPKESQNLGSSTQLFQLSPEGAEKGFEPSPGAGSASSSPVTLEKIAREELKSLKKVNEELRNHQEDLERARTVARRREKCKLNPDPEITEWINTDEIEIAHLKEKIKVHAHNFEHLKEELENQEPSPQDDMSDEPLPVVDRERISAWRDNSSSFGRDVDKEEGKSG